MMSARQPVGRLAPVGPRIRSVTDDVVQLVLAAQDGDERAWNGLVDAYGRLVWHVIRGFRLPDAAAEDVYQTTWLRLAENLDRIREPASVGGWLARTARNECLRSVKVRGRETLRDDFDLDLSDSGPAVDQAIDDDARNEILWQAFENLSEPCQRLLRLLIADPPPSYEQVSELMDMSIGSIGPTRARCLAKLRTSKGVHLLGHER